MATLEYTSRQNSVQGIKTITGQTFGGSSGVTVILPVAMLLTNYVVSIQPLSVTGLIGEISVENKALNTFVVKNSGSDTSTQFDCQVIDLS